jgi:hypothetical protein
VGANDFRITGMGPDGDAAYNAFGPALIYNGSLNEYFVVWYGDTDAGSLVDEEYEIYGQRLNGVTGTLVGAAIRISYMGPDGDSRYDAIYPAIAYNSQDNQYFVVWRGSDDTPPLALGEVEIYGQRIDANTGNLLGPELRLSDMGPDGTAFCFGSTPAVAYNNTANEYLVAWKGDDTTCTAADDEFEIFAQRVSATGAQTGVNDFRISNAGPDGTVNFDAVDPRIAYNTALNEYLVVWRADDNTAPLVDEEFEVFGQRLSASGMELGVDDFRISDMGPNGSTAYSVSDPDVVYNSLSNEYLVVWRGDDDRFGLVSGELEVFGQRLNATGAEAGDNDFRISDMGPDGDPSYGAFLARVTHNPTLNEYLVVWYGDDNTGLLVNNEFEEYGQRLSATGQSVGLNDFRVSDAGPDGNPNFDVSDNAVIYNSTQQEYLVIWEADDDTPPLIDNDDELFGQRLNMVEQVYLPLALRSYIAYYAGAFETEPNNAAAQANGPLRSGQVYQGAPNDDRDYFSVFLPVAGALNVSLTGHTGSGVQLQLFYQTAGNVVAFDTAAPYQLSYSGGPGLYYVYIFSAGNYSPTPAYNLVVTYPTE